MVILPGKKIKRLISDEMSNSNKFRRFRIPFFELLDAFFKLFVFRQIKSGDNGLDKWKLLEKKFTNTANYRIWVIINFICRFNWCVSFSTNQTLINLFNNICFFWKHLFIILASSYHFWALFYFNLCGILLVLVST